MQLPEVRRDQLKTEFKFSASRSGGPGGQNVNKVNTRVELRFSIQLSQILTEQEKEILRVKLKKRINTEDELILVSGSERSQWRNKEKAVIRFFELIEKALTPVKKRIKTKPSAASKLKRLESKKIQAAKKRLRKPPKE